MTQNMLANHPSGAFHSWGHPSLLTLGLLTGLLMTGEEMNAIADDTAPRPKAANQNRLAAFNLTTSTIDIEAIHSGGPQKDGIPAISRPVFLPGKQADFMQPFYRVIGVSLNNEQRAYPLIVMNYHEVVNDVLGDTKLAVTYCPLCDSAVVFDRETPLGEREFGVSGLLHNSNVLIYDRGGQPESLWSQIQSSGVTGPAAGEKLQVLPCELTTWKSWSTRFPETSVMTLETGFKREYRVNPYQPYFQVQQLMFPASPSDNRFPNKERILGVWVGDTFKAYPESRFPPGQNEITDTIEGLTLTIVFDAADKSIRVTNADPGISWLYSFWFAWYAQHPSTSVFDTPVTSTEDNR